MWGDPNSVFRCKISNTKVIQVFIGATIFTLHIYNIFSPQILSLVMATGWERLRRVALRSMTTRGLALAVSSISPTRSGEQTTLTVPRITAVLWLMVRPTTGATTAALIKTTLSVSLVLTRRQYL